MNIDDWQFYAEITNVKSAILFQSEHAQWHMAQNCQYIKFVNYLSTGKFAKYYSCQYLIILPINNLVW